MKRRTKFAPAYFDRRRERVRLGENKGLYLEVMLFNGWRIEAKDRNYRKKIREQALVKVRRYRDVVSKDPAFTALMTESNPWSRSGGAVQGLDLMRALNDLDLNLQRSI